MRLTLVKYNASGGVSREEIDSDFIKLEIELPNGQKILLSPGFDLIGIHPTQKNDVLAVIKDGRWLRIWIKNDFNQKYRLGSSSDQD